MCEWAGCVAHIEETRDLYNILVGNTEIKKQLQRHRRRWENNIKVDFKE
jgi:hypothetical protein